MTPLYYFPKIEYLPNWKFLPPKCQLETTLDEAPFSSFPIPKGPDGQAGTVIVIDPAPGTGGQQASVNYDPETQTWTPIEDQSGEYTHWLGWEIKSPPRAVDLVRPSLTPGEILVMHEEEWCIPTLSLAGPLFTTLPKRHVWRKGGLALDIQDRYQDLCQRAQKHFDWFRHQHGFEDVEVERLAMETFEQCYFACDVLNVNYRVGPPEVTVFFPWFNSNSILAITQYALGMTHWEKQATAQKKT